MPAPVKIESMTVAKGPKHLLFSLRANGIPLSVSCTLAEYYEDNKNTMDKVNENFRNSIRYIKLYKNLPKNPDKKKLAVWTQSDTGISVRGNKMLVPEFQPFTF